MYVTLRSLTFDPILPEKECLIFRQNLLKCSLHDYILHRTFRKNYIHALLETSNVLVHQLTSLGYSYHASKGPWNISPSEWGYLMALRKCISPFFKIATKSFKRQFQRFQRIPIRLGLLFSALSSILPNGRSIVFTLDD